MGGDARGGSRGTSVRDVQRVVLSRIVGGDPPVGGRLPSCEELGRQLGANKNTVSKAYQALARRGYLASHPGRGTFVVHRPRGADRREAVAEIHALMQSAIEQADLVGLSLEEFAEMARETASRYFDRARLRVGYVDGTRADARDLGGELQNALAVPIEPLIVDQVLKDPEGVVGRFDVLAVNLSHLGTVERGLRRALEGSTTEVVPILSRPDPESLTQVARLAEGTRLAIVVETEDTLPRLAGMCTSINPAVQIDGLLAASPKLAQTLAWADVVLLTAASQARVGRLDRPISIIEATFRIDEQSTAALADVIGSRQRVSGDGPAPVVTST